MTEFSIIIGQDWHHLTAPPWVAFVPDFKAHKAGWCKDRPLAAYPHPCIFEGHEGGKFCTKPLVQAALFPLDAYMEYGGCGARSNDYVRAKALYGTRTIEQGNLLETV